MSGDGKIDFQALDPSADKERWAKMVASVTARALSRRTRSVPLQLLAWARPVLAMAAALAVVVWVGAALADKSRASERPEPAVVLSQWASSEELPSAAHLFDLLGTEHDSR